jgi:hypothetical protein
MQSKCRKTLGESKSENQRQITEIQKENKGIFCEAQTLQVGGVLLPLSK